MYVDNVDVKFVLELLENDFSQEIEKFNYAYIAGKLSVLRDLSLISLSEYEKYNNILEEGLMRNVG